MNFLIHPRIFIIPDFEKSHLKMWNDLDPPVKLPTVRDFTHELPPAHFGKRLVNVNAGLVRGFVFFLAYS